MRILNIFFIVLVTSLTTMYAPHVVLAKEIIFYSFEKDPDGWEIPDWALAKKDHVARQLSISEFHASEGKYALEMGVDFSGGSRWEGAYVERVIDVTDWSPFNYLTADIYLPKEAPQGLRARFILSVGEDWKWTEMNRSFPLTPGEWTVVKADISPNSMAWRRFIDESFRADVKKFGIRIESNGKIVYKGPAYIDNVKLTD